MTLGGRTISQSIFKFKFAFIPGLAYAQIVADKLKLGAKSTESSVIIPLVARDAFHLGLSESAVVIILAVRAATTTSLSLIDLHRLAYRHPECLIGIRFIARVFRTKHPIVNDDLRVLFVLGSRDEWFAFTQASKPADDSYGLFHATISLPDPRIVSALAALAMVDMNEPESSTWPTSSGNA